MAFVKGLFVCAFILLVVLQGATCNTTYDVLGSLGWSIPPAGDVAYRTWAAGKTFHVGDILYFNFTTGHHDVAEFTKADYDACNTSNPISNVILDPVNIPLESEGDKYFICTFPGHCGLGQKLAITVSSTSSTNTSPESSPSNAASSIALGAFSVAFLSIAMAFLY